ncbi:MAG: alpha/beta hydrolase family protein [Henriciella sp.]
MRVDPKAIPKLFASVAATLLAAGCISGDAVKSDAGPSNRLAGDRLDRLSDLSIEALRSRAYGGGELNVVARIDRDCTTQEASGDRSKPALRALATYSSEGHNVYARIDVPNSAPPETGYPVMIFAHGWVGAENAPDWHFACTTESSYGDIYGDVINAWVDAGFVVLVPGYRGHGTVNGIPADGHGDMLAWDNGAYLMPSFYAVDVMNLMAISTRPGAIQITGEDGVPQTAQVDASRMFINGHSQGGDVALTVLAAVGEGAASGLELAGGSIWAGNIADRFTQLATFEAMSTSPEAFLSGDGTWTGSATGEDGSSNPNFVFGFPPDWIGSPHPEDWTWQVETFSAATVAEAMSAKATDMYSTLNARVREYGDLSWAIAVNAEGRDFVAHDPRLLAPIAQIGGTNAVPFLTELLHLHYSDRDYYSLPQWNEQLCADITAIGGTCQTYEYAGNTHSLGLSEHEWFSPPGSVAGHAQFIQNDLCVFADDGVAKGTNCQKGENR